MSSPHARGWSGVARYPSSCTDVVPARAGVVLARARGPGPGRSRPRTRGGGPRVERVPEPLVVSSPHARGWSMTPRRHGAMTSVVPARAGVVPTVLEFTDAEIRSSPHARGWSAVEGTELQLDAVVPARAGVVLLRVEAHGGDAGRPRTRGGGPGGGPRPGRVERSSPHARGWSIGGVDPKIVEAVVPARAGVVRWPGGGRWAASRRPRTRGGGPLPSCLEGVPPSSSPHARGWSLAGIGGEEHVGVVPARAGVVPREDHHPHDHHRRPRTRGGGPRGTTTRTSCSRSSPHARGWSVPGSQVEFGGAVVPARAGVVRCGAG